MLNVTKELTALVRKLGYTGKAPDTVASASRNASPAAKRKNPKLNRVK